MPGRRLQGHKREGQHGPQLQGKHISQSSSPPRHTASLQESYIIVKESRPPSPPTAGGQARWICLGSSLASSRSRWLVGLRAHSPLRKMHTHLTGVQTAAWSPGPHRDTGEGQGCNPGLLAGARPHRPAPVQSAVPPCLNKQPPAKDSSPATPASRTPCVPHPGGHAVACKGGTGARPASLLLPSDIGRWLWALHSTE